MVPFDRKGKGKARQEPYPQRERVTHSSSASENVRLGVQRGRSEVRSSISARDMDVRGSMVHEAGDMKSVSDTSSDLTPPRSNDERVSLPLLSSTGTQVKQEEGSSSNQSQSHVRACKINQEDSSDQVESLSASGVASMLLAVLLGPRQRMEPLTNSKLACKRVESSKKIDVMRRRLHG